MIYPRRLWNDYSCHVYLLDEKKWVDLEEMDEAEFRRFVLWRLGVALPKPSRNLRRSMESAPAQARMRLKYDVKRLQRTDRK